MSAGFTLGPWERRGLTVFEAGKTAMSIAVATQHEANAQANARLIAAAPDLYEELAQQADGSATIIGLLRGQNSPVAASLIGMLSIQEQSARSVLARASAIEAATAAETPQDGSVHESAMPKADAQTPSGPSA